ncbi:hypothetical protein ACHWQZ_G010018 [Mnemiopsis leidyi]
MEPNNLQDLQDLIISTECPDTEDKAWSIPVQILIDQYESTKYNDALCLGNFSFVLQPDESPQPPVDHPSTTTVKTVRKEAKKHKSQKTRGTSTLHFCGKCSKEFSSKTRFIRHLKSHSDEKAFQCHLCDRSYKHSWLRDKHVKMKHTEHMPPCDRSGKVKGGKIHLCEICHEKFPYWNAYLHHVKTHNGVKDLHCSKDGCNKSFKTVSQLNDHIKGHDNAFLCEICNKAYRSRSALKFHLQKHQNNVIEFKCSVCQQVFASEKALKMHNRSHSRNKKPGFEKYLHCDRSLRDVTELDKISSSNMAGQESNIISEKVDNHQWFRCRLCPNFRSSSLSTVMSHVCMTHSLETVTEKVIAKNQYQKIV